MLKSGRAIVLYPFRLASTDIRHFEGRSRHEAHGLPTLSMPPEVSAGFLPADTKVRVWNGGAYRGMTAEKQAQPAPSGGFPCAFAPSARTRPPGRRHYAICC